MTPTLRQFVAFLRGYRLTLRQRAAEADAAGRPDYALAVWHVLQDLGAFLELLTSRKEPSHAHHRQPHSPQDVGSQAP